MIACPTCGRKKAAFAIRNGRCRDDLMDEARVVAAQSRKGKRPELTWEDIRAERDKRLASTDWTQLKDADVDDKTWAAYRRALKDITKDFKSPKEVIWPTPPE